MTKVKEVFVDWMVVACALWVPIIAVLLMWFVAIPLVFIAIGFQYIANRMVDGAEWLASKLEQLMA